MRTLTRRCLDRLIEIGWPAVTPNDDERRGPLVAVPHALPRGGSRPRGDPEPPRDGTVRASCHFYNNEAAIERFPGALTAYRTAFEPR